MGAENVRLVDGGRGDGGAPRASALLEAGVSIRAVSEYLGHADPGFTLRIYAHLMPTSDERARQAMDLALGVQSQDHADVVPSGG